MTRSWTHILSVCALVVAFCQGNSARADFEVNLTRSSEFAPVHQPSGVYGTVTVDIIDSDSATLTFKVADPSPYDSIDSSKYGFDSVAFNLNGVTFSSISITTPASGWQSAKTPPTNTQQNGFGSFDYLFEKNTGKGSDAGSPTVVITLSGLTSGTLSDSSFQELSSGGTSVWFAGHIKGFTESGKSSHFVGGNEDDVVIQQVVPAPSSLVLGVMGALFLSVGGYTYRRRQVTPVAC